MIPRILVAFMAALFISASVAEAAQVGEKNNGLSICDEQYLNLYDEAEQLGWPLGRNAVEAARPDSVICKQVPKLEAAITVITAPPPPPAAEPVAAVPEPSEPAPVTSSGGGAGGSTVQCESGGDYSINTGNGYYGGWQFDSGTWDAYGDSGYAEAHLAPPAVQDAAAAAVPYDAWPNC